jgi:hypothetical protein
MSEAGRRGFDGRDANRNIMQSASSISRTASMKVGYLQKRIEHK